MNESQLKKGLEAYLKTDFDLFPEQYGIYKSDDVENRVRIDYLAKAKPHLIERGFPDDYFGIEVKAWGDDPKLKKINETIGQCQIYRNTKFLKNLKQPFAVFLFTDMFIISDEPMNIRSHVDRVLRYCKLFNVGRIEMGKGQIIFRLGIEEFFSKYKNEIAFETSRNYHLGTIRQSGNVNKLNEYTNGNTSDSTEIQS